MVRVHFSIILLNSYFNYHKIDLISRDYFCKNLNICIVIPINTI